MNAPIMTGAEPHEISSLVKAFHYSRRMPSNIQHCYAIREEGGLFGDTGAPVAGIIFAIPPTRWSEEVLELARLVRDPICTIPLTQLIAFAIKQLKRNGWDLLVSFADWTQKHHGGIYQAAGWNYNGLREATMDGLVINGTFVPGRSCNSNYGTRSPTLLRERLPDHEVNPHYDEGKHLYWKALTKVGVKRADRLGLQSLPYPKPDTAQPHCLRVSRAGDPALAAPRALETAAGALQPSGSAPAGFVITKEPDHAV